ncbi:MAG: LysM peptidoglycan-binding domain-containing M23 family metallopeptidase [Magnetospirillum sp. WYHS-4]
MRNLRGLLLAAATGLLVSGCAYVEWPPRGGQGQVSQPAQPAETSSMFAGAEAVTVGKGDSVHGLAKRHGVSARAIIDANGLKAPYTLKVGQRIVLPRDREHVVQKGEGLHAIARFHNVDSYEMARLNGLSPPYKVLMGQRLRIPGSATGGGAVTAQAAPPPAAQPVPRVEGVTLEPPKDRDTYTAPSSMGIEALPPPTAPAGPAPAPLPPPAMPASQAPVAPLPPPIDVGQAPGAAVADAPPPPPRPSLPEPPPVSGKGFAWPVKGKVLSGFGPKEKGLQNDGINIAASAGTPILAAEDGVIAYVGNELRGFGNLVLIKHSDGVTTAYAHTEEILVKRGETVAKGQTIARVGATGGVKAPQLHFEVRKGKQPVDPLRYLPS